jgi:dephospho-CoA kinase
LIRVGLTGGYASGKSLVAREFERLGCRLIYADKLGHEVMLPGGPAYQPILSEFGNSILDEDSSIDRKKLADIVFHQPALLEKLNGIVHPAVFVREDALAAAYAAEDPMAIVVIEAAILIETGHYRTLNRLVLVSCPEELQIARGMKRDHVPREEALERIRRQMPLDEKRRYADYIIDTSGTKEHTFQQTEAVYASLKEYSESYDTRAIPEG